MILALCLLAMPQEIELDDWFRLHQLPSRGRVVVSANRESAGAARALEELARQMHWRLSFETESVREQLDPVLLHLAFSRRDPRSIAELIAAAGGAVVDFEAVDGELRVRVGATVTDATVSGTGTAGMRRRAVDWYRHILDGDAPVSGRSRFEAMMGLGGALLDAGELAAAVDVFNRVFEEDDSREFAKQALYRVGGAHLALATRADQVASVRTTQLLLAERSVRQALRMRLEPSARSAAVLLLGRILFTDKRYRDCLEIIEADWSLIVDAKELVDVSLLAASCHSLQGLHRQALDTLNRLVRQPGQGLWSRSQWLDYQFLRGIGHEALSRESVDEREKARLRTLARRSLELFLGVEDNERASIELDARPQRLRAMMALSSTYLESAMYLQARSAIAFVVANQNRLAAPDRQRMKLLDARIAIELGWAESALAKLERAVRPDPANQPELMTFLIDALTEMGQYERALEIADLVAEETGSFADECRFRRIVALLAQARAKGSMRTFPVAAAVILDTVGSEAVRAKIGRMIGQSYEQLQTMEEAIAAYPPGERIDLGRALVKAGRFEDALRELSHVSENAEAGWSELFLLACCHAELHSRLTSAAHAAQRRSGAPSETDAATQIAEFLRKAAGHYEKAYDLFVRIESEDVHRSSDGEPSPGDWARSARSARETMRWVDRSRAWTPPRIRWRSK